MQKALIVVDMLNDFICPDGALYCGKAAEAIVPFVRGKIDAFRENGDLVIFICDRHAADDAEFARFPAHCVEDTHGAEVIDALRFDGFEDCITGKQRYSGFYNTDLEDQLEEIEEVAVVGVCTNICVLYTVEGLCNRDKKVAVYREGIAAFDDAAHAFALEQMKSVLGAEIV